MNFLKTYFNKKSPAFIPALILCFIFILAIFTPGNFLNKFFNKNLQVATVFTSNTTGSWNNMVTWGSPHFKVFSAPTDLAVSSSGLIYVSDWGNNRVVVLNQDGTASTSYSDLSPLSPNTFSYPSGIAISPSGYIYVAAQQGGRVVLLNPDGTASTSYSNLSPLSPNTFSFLEQIVLSPKNELYVVDTSNQRIVVLNPNGTASTSYSNLSPLSPSTFTYPRGVAISSTGNIYIADGNNNRIVVLNPDGTASTSYSNLSPLSPSTFNQLGSIAFSSTGNIYVADGSRIVVLNPDGTASTSYSNVSPLSPSSFVSRGIFIDPSNKIYFSDNNNRIVILNPDGTVFNSYNGTAVPPGYVQTAGVDFPGINDDVIINTGTVTLSADQNVNNLTLATGGTLDLNGHILNVSGNWSNAGGTLINNGGTVNFVSNQSQIISGSNTFYNLTKIATTSSASLLFTSISTTTITNNLTLTGPGGNLLTIDYYATTTPQYYFQFGSSGSGNGQFNFPHQINFDSQGNVYIADTINHRIQKFSSAGVFISKLGSLGSGNGQFTAPQGVAIDAQDNIYVGDTQNSRVQKFSSTTAYISQFGSNGGGASQFSNPTSISFDSQGNIYVLDQNNARVQKFDSNNNFILMFGKGVNQTIGGNICTAISGNTCKAGSSGTANGEFSNPSGIAVDANDNIYVVNSGNARIDKFDSNGNFIFKFGSSPTGNSLPSQFNNAQDITIDSVGDLYVTDWFNRVQKFSATGVFIKQFGSFGSGDGQLSAPTNLIVDHSGNIYVVDMNNKRVEVFSQGNPSFNIISSGTANLSYLSVSRSNNNSSFSFDCSLGCVDTGGNTNWVFGQTTHRRSATSSTPVVIPPVISSGSASTTSSSTTTPITLIATSTPLVAASTSQLPSVFCFTKNLYQYTSDADVKELEIFLQEKDFYASSSIVSNYFSPELSIAVTAFQNTYASELVTPFGLTVGNGNVGNYTRKKINDILGCPTIFQVIATTTPKVIVTPAPIVPVIEKPITTTKNGLVVPALPNVITVPTQPSAPSVVVPINTTQPTNQIPVATSPSQIPQLSNLVKGLQSIIPADLLLTAHTGKSTKDNPLKLFTLFNDKPLLNNLLIDGICTPRPGCNRPCPTDGICTPRPGCNRPCPTDGICTPRPGCNRPCPTDGICTPRPGCNRPCPTDGICTDKIGFDKYLIFNGTNVAKVFLNVVANEGICTPKIFINANELFKKPGKVKSITGTFLKVPLCGDKSTFS